ncbi:MAG: AAA family ATPase [Roseivirga sp.]|nr:AAA family ATPase [Roseivirga sp.]
MSYRIKKLLIKDFKGIKHTQLENLPARAKWIFLTGENGYGKTSVLQAIAAGLAGMEEHMFSLFRDTSNAPHIKIELTDSSQFDLRGLQSLPNSGDEYFRQLACYGSSRLQTYTESSKRNKGITSALFDSTTNLENIELQLTRWLSKLDIADFRNKHRHVKELLINLLDLSDIEIDRATDTVFYIEQDTGGNKYPKQQLGDLASGYRNLIGFIGDLIIKLFDRQPSIHNPKELEGIVIIDELDLHLHPKWQKKLPGLLSRLFPNIQFIASTHSPIPLLGAPKNSVIIRINRTVEEGITMERLKDEEKNLSNLLPNTILTSPAFGLLEIFPESDNDQEVRTEDDYFELKANDYMRKKLRGQQNSDLEADLLNYIKGSKK